MYVRAFVRNLLARLLAKPLYVVDAVEPMFEETLLEIATSYQLEDQIEP